VLSVAQQDRPSGSRPWRTSLWDQLLALSVTRSTTKLLRLKKTPAFPLAEIAARNPATTKVVIRRILYKLEGGGLDELLSATARGAPSASTARPWPRHPRPRKEPPGTHAGKIGSPRADPGCDPVRPALGAYRQGPRSCFHSSFASSPGKLVRSATYCESSAFPVRLWLRSGPRALRSIKGAGMEKGSSNATGLALVQRAGDPKPRPRPQHGSTAAQRSAEATGPP